jgi:hypothetical protein
MALRGSTGQLPCKEFEISLSAFRYHSSLFIAEVHDLQFGLMLFTLYFRQVFGG